MRLEDPKSKTSLEAYRAANVESCECCSSDIETKLRYLVLKHDNMKDFLVDGTLCDQCLRGIHRLIGKLIVSKERL